MCMNQYFRLNYLFVNFSKLILLLHLEGELLFGLGKILYQPTAPKDSDSSFDKTECLF
jgi:hypothetical protein